MQRKPQARPVRHPEWIAPTLLAWYDRHRRCLPWRAGPGLRADPYAVWLSEIMLQQTTVAAVKPYFERFLARWPDVTALAAADEHAVMREWAGLGYYARARNLMAAARIVSSAHGGAFPTSTKGLRALPGVGEYTAAAIAAIAFGEPAVVVDGNVERVLARLVAHEAPFPGAKRAMRHLAAVLTPAARPGDYAQAMMDLGAMICTPRNPACALCPLRTYCAAHAQGASERYPVKAPKRPRPARHGIAYVLLDRDDRLLVRTRPAPGLLAGTVEVPGSPWLDRGETVPEAPPLPGRWREMGTITHVFTHFALTLRVRRGRCARAIAAPAGMRWVEQAAIAREPWSSLMVKVLRAADDEATEGGALQAARPRSRARSASSG